MPLSQDTIPSPSSLYCAEDATSCVVDDEPIALSTETTIDPITRKHAVIWILKVNEFYTFRPVTAYLAVSYLDRLLSVSSLPPENAGWAMQLLSVACLSVAAKMEETHIPLLLDLQILDPRYVFDPRTVRRMELLLMSTLHWRLRSVTPFDFLPPAHLSRAAEVILRMTAVVGSLCYRPSEIAAAAAEVAGWPAEDEADRSGKWVPGCGDGGCQLMDECLDDTWRTAVVLDAAGVRELAEQATPACWELKRRFYP